MTKQEVKALARYYEHVRLDATKDFAEKLLQNWKDVRRLKEMNYEDAVDWMEEYLKNKLL